MKTFHEAWETVLPKLQDESDLVKHRYQATFYLGGLSTAKLVSNGASINVLRKEIVGYQIAVRVNGNPPMTDSLLHETWVSYVEYTGVTDRLVLYRGAFFYGALFFDKLMSELNLSEQRDLLEELNIFYDAIGDITNLFKQEI